MATSPDCSTSSNSTASTSKLQSLDAALATLLAEARTISQTETVSLQQANGRILASDLSSVIAVPPADNSAMDGYAINHADYSGKPLPVSQRIAAGTAPKPLNAGTAARIFTGAFIPEGANAVIMQENATRDNDGNVSFHGATLDGQNIRRRGEDIAAGQIILKAGRKLLPQDIGLAASVGINKIPVFRPLKVATFFTGDELVRPGQPLREGQIYNSNQYVLDALLQQLGCEVISIGIIQDTLDATLRTLTEVTRQADLVITSGGVSVGEEDHVRIALESLGTLSFWRLAMKPGKPVAFGHVNETPVIGLPGNPVSVFTTFCLLARPFLLRMQGCKQVLPRFFPVTAGFDWHKAGDRREFARARLETDSTGTQTAVLYSNQGSGVLSSTSWADGLVEIREQNIVAKGDKVNFYAFTEFYS